MDEDEYRRIFDTIPEQFDRYRPRYCPELFCDLIAFAGVGPDSCVLELGPGTGQATEPLLDTGCDYCAIELGHNFAALLNEKYGARPNFALINDDFLTYDFADQRFDLIYSAATIQWMPEQEAFSKIFSLLRPGGTLAMMYTSGDYRTPDEALFNEIQKVYKQYFKPKYEYKHRGFGYGNTGEYGFENSQRREYRGRREYTGDEYAAMSGTHSDHLVIPEPYRTKFFDGLRRAVRDAGDRIVFLDTHVLYLAKKPE